MVVATSLPPPHTHTADTSYVQLPHSLVCVKSTLLKQERKLTGQSRTHKQTHKQQAQRQRRLVCASFPWWSNTAGPCVDVFGAGYISLEAEQGWEDQVEELVGLHCQHAPAVSEHPEAAQLWCKVSSSTRYILYLLLTMLHLNCTSRLSHRTSGHLGSCVNPKVACSGVG